MTIRGRGADAVTRSESLGPEECSVQHVLCPLVMQRELVRFLYTFRCGFPIGCAARAYAELTCASPRCSSAREICETRTTTRFGHFDQ